MRIVPQKNSREVRSIIVVVRYLQGNIQALTPCKADEKQHDMGKQNGLVQPSPSMWLLFENFV